MAWTCYKQEKQNEQWEARAKKETNQEGALILTVQNLVVIQA